MQRLIFASLLWAVGTLQTLAQPPKLMIPGYPADAVRCLAVSPDGSLLASASGREVRFWDYESGRLLALHDLPALSVFTSTINHFAFSPDSRYLGALSGEAFFLFDTQSLSLIDRKNLVKGAYSTQDQIGGITALPNSKAFLFEMAQGEESAIIRYNYQSQTIDLLHQFAYPGKERRPANLLSTDPSGTQLLLSYLGTNEAAIVNLNNKSVLPYPGGLAWLPDGNLLLQKRTDQKIDFSVATPSGRLLWTDGAVQSSIKAKGKYYNNLALSNDNRFYYGLDEGGMLLGKTDGSFPLRYLDKPGKAMGSPLAFAKKDGLLLTTGKNPNTIAAYDPSTGVLRRSFGVPIMAVSMLKTDPASLSFAVSSRAGELRNIALGPREPVQAVRSPGAGFVAISPGGRFTAATGKNQGAITWQDGQSRKVLQIVPMYSSPKAIALDVNGNMAVAAAEGIAYYKAGQLQPTWSATGLSYDKAYAKTYTLAFSPDGQQLVANDFLNSKDGAMVVRSFSTATGKQAWQTEAEFENFQFTTDGKLLKGTAYLRELKVFNAKNGKLVSTRTRTDGEHFGARFDQKLDLLSGSERPDGSTNTVATIVSEATGKVKQRLAGHTGTINATGFLADGFFLTAGFDNTIRLWDLQKGKETAKLFFFDGSEDWVVLHTDGRFDATPSAMQKLYYVSGRRVIPLEQLYEGFYTPGLLGLILGRSAVPAPSPVPIGKLAPAPKVSIRFSEGNRNLIVEDDVPASAGPVVLQTPNLTLEVKAVSGQARLESIRLYHNGKLVGERSRNLVVEEDEGSPLEMSRSYMLTLLPGEHHFRAIAINAEQTESPPAELRISYQPLAPSIKEVQQITLHLMSIGLNQYKNPRYNLNYAHADADGIEASIKQGMQGIVGEIKTYRLRDKQADREGILSMIEQVKATAKPNDVFVFYYAGHGVMSDGAQPEFFLVPYDVTQLYGNEGALAEKGVSASELRDFAGSIPAQKQLYILDACNSAGAGQALAVRGAAEEKAIAQLARSTGTHWLTSTGSAQFASEFDELGHGAFTFVLLEGLSGKAAGADRKVSVNELKAYLDDVVPALTEKHTGIPQYPASFGFGQDFPVSVQ